MTDLRDFARLVGRDHGLCVVSTLQPDSTIQSSVVNAGVLIHPITGRPVVGLAVLNPSGLFFNDAIPYDVGVPGADSALCEGREFMPGSWHWPAREDG